MEPPSTHWRIVGMDDWPNRLNISLVCDTTAPSVIEAIEKAAESNGIELVRVENA